MLTDLPGQVTAERRAGARSSPATPRALLVAVVFVVASLWSAMFAPHVPWLLIALIVFLIWRRDRFGRYYNRGYRYRHRVFDERPW